ncbi:TRAFs-binding domain-containing protein [Hymenobacter monticola]|uniref:TRAFs-binding domain-containing protein n=1 Tax=Hymenobacter monticola TaxID=1705399 RepID=A0ABY4BE86_9BACT|nr:TRAFs-binding domain-containing protein [Hymenobacter monticola]UOE36046.1 TRAFs-binding domain-containing protein [Hymenobacter monticola]
MARRPTFETGRLLDLDVSYKNMIKPAVEAAGLRCIRADEIVHSGLIDVPMYEHLLNADVVVADLSTSNKNAFYELGVRHALRPQTTIIIAEDGIKAFPFDINHVAVRQYHHLGEDINAVEARRFQAMLTDAIEQILANDPVSRDSPVYTFLDLTPPALKKVQEAALITMAAASNLAAVSTAASKQTHMALMNRVSAAQKQGKWFKMQVLLEVVRENQAQARAEARQTATVQLSQDDREDPYILQQLALATYKSKEPSPEQALLDARALLVPLTPATTNDTETLGMWGSIHKRLWDLTKAKPAAEQAADRARYLDEAVRAYERGFYLRNDYYNGINLAFLLNARAAEPTASAAEAIADYVQAQRVRKEVITLCDQWLATQAAFQALGEPAAGPEQQKDAANRYWVLASKGEAYLGLGQPEQGNQTLQEAYALAPELWMKASTEEQLAKLNELLATNPLQFITSAA